MDKNSWYLQFYCITGSYWSGCSKFVALKGKNRFRKEWS